MHTESHQTDGFVAESQRFVSSHLGNYPGAPEWILRSTTLRSSPISSILDVGCGPGTYLTSMVQDFNAEVGVGVEPSPDAVALLIEHYNDDQRLEFACASAHSLPFATDSFDLVVCWSVLHWVGRNEYLQAIGELVRVSRRHLVIMDFVPAEPFRVVYGHDDRYFTYKNDFAPVVLASGIMRMVEDRRWWDAHHAGSVNDISENDLEPFLRNELNYHARRGVIFMKDYELLSVLSEADFA